MSRFDHRSKEQFIEDIAKSTKKERILLDLWLKLQEKPLQVVDTGCGNDGKFLENKDVTSKADFFIESFGPFEVKFSEKLLPKVFHLKENNVKSYIEEGATVMMVNGADNEDAAVYTLINPKQLAEIAATIEPLPFFGMGNKVCYKIPVNKFIWRKLK